MKVLFCGGGTAGHISPAIAIAEEILRRYPQSSICFIGRDGGEENYAITKAGYTMKTIRVYGFDRKISLKNAKCVFIAVKAFFSAKRQLKETKPDIVVGTGGYVCLPVIRAAQALKIPTVIHESNAVAGLSTRLVAPGCNRVFLNFDSCKKTLKAHDNVITVGNPIKREFFELSHSSARARLGIPEEAFSIVSFGGSLGAERLNEACIFLMKEYSLKNPSVHHTHAVGRRYYEKIKNAYPELCSGNGRVKIVPYIENMPQRLAASDTVICRSGAMTVSEICATGSPSILIPSPNVTDNHQYKNAKLLNDSGAALLIEENKLSAEVLIKTVEKIRSSASLRLKMRASIKKFSSKNAAEKIVKEIGQILGESTEK